MRAPDFRSVRALPAGTVTFLFTDVEGSTRLLGELGGERYAESLAEHRRLLRDEFARHGGVEVDTQGDAFFIAFARASDAISAAQRAQEALSATSIRVRIDAAEEIGFHWWHGTTLISAAEYAEQAGRIEDAERWAREALPAVVRIDNRMGAITALALLARVATRRDEPGRAGLLWGAVEAEEARAPVGGWWQVEREAFSGPVLAAASAQFDRARSEGVRLSLVQAVEAALADA